MTIKITEKQLGLIVKLVQREHKNLWSNSEDYSPQPQADTEYREEVSALEDRLWSYQEFYRLKAFLEVEE